MPRIPTLLAALLLSSTAFAAPVSLSTADGISIHADASGQGDHGVLLVHQANGSSQEYNYLSQKLSKLSYHVLSIDLRQHGASGSGPIAEDTFPLMVNDVTAGISWLSDKGAKEITVIGAKFGANLALSAATDPRVTSLILVSPGFNLRGVNISPIKSYGDRPLMLIASANDTSALKAVNALEGLASGKTNLLVGDGNASGAALIGRDPLIESALIKWLSGAQALSDAEQSDIVTTPKLDATEEQTTGVRFGDR
jgi:pimeloyl-ACP methyl ester carboxylesterase